MFHLTFSISKCNCGSIGWQKQQQKKRIDKNVIGGGSRKRARSSALQENVKEYNRSKTIFNTMTGYIFTYNCASFNVHVEQLIVELGLTRWNPHFHWKRKQKSGLVRGSVEWTQHTTTYMTKTAVCMCDWHRLVIHYELMHQQTLLHTVARTESSYFVFHIISTWNFGIRDTQPTNNNNNRHNRKR